MLGIDSSELLLIALVALVVIGPKDLPKAMRVVGYWVGRARGVARQFRQGFDNMVREAELEEMEKKWAAENERIMREHPPTPAEPVERSWDNEPVSAGDGALPPHDSGHEGEGHIAAHADEDRPALSTPAPLFVDTPHVEPAPADRAGPRAGSAHGDGVTS
ncbi:sec-independent protein translocase protein TatB [Sphingomonas gellani]|uniref:Sec-independent protein translocase protein TatB n=1 Tax=Sphingomonas gellani TaxID=1166340 RepID=A0A1H8FMY8_9SPHN|nr:Sec-independent protein translocase protein TatB [Sphingomonas gellani]SEN33059.1 sec-independent protein translocase protein TatB [Sphingomonas gellani]